MDGLFTNYTAYKPFDTSLFHNKARRDLQTFHLILVAMDIDRERQSQENQRPPSYVPPPEEPQTFGLRHLPSTFLRKREKGGGECRRIIK